jgi:hypothetical protein
MDALDRVAAAGRDLLGRVDDVLVAGGAPAGDPVWPLLRRAGALPGDLLDQLLGADPQPLYDAADQLRGDARALGDTVDSIPGVAGWRGAAADAYAGQWSAAVGQVDRITGRLGASGDYAADVAAWVATTRRQLAGAVAECLGSTEAATVRLARPGPPEPTVCAAAAAIAAHLLTVALDAADAGEALRQRWAGRLDEVRYSPPAPVPSGVPAGVIEVGTSDQPFRRG